MDSQSSALAKNAKRASRRFFAASAVAVVLVSAASTGIVLAYQMRLLRQTGQLDAQINQGPQVLVEPLRPRASLRQYEIPITMRGYVETPVYAKIAGYLKTIYSR